MFTLSSVYFLFSPFFISNSDLTLFGIGGFLAGLVIPHDNGYTISITEKLENLVTIIFLPLVRATRST